MRVYTENQTEKKPARKLYKPSHAGFLGAHDDAEEHPHSESEHSTHDCLYDSSRVAVFQARRLVDSKQAHEHRKRSEHKAADGDRQILQRVQRSRGATATVRYGDMMVDLAAIGDHAAL